MNSKILSMEMAMSEGDKVVVVGKQKIYEVLKRVYAELEVNTGYFYVCLYHVVGTVALYSYLLVPTKTF